MDISKILRTIARIFLGVVFTFSGYTKIIDPMGSAIKFGEYFEAISFLGFMQPYALLFGVLLAVAEISIGICYLLGINMKLTSLAGMLFMLFFTPLTLWLAITDAVKDCGCFGDAVKLSNWGTFYKNLVILPISVYIFLIRKQYKPLFKCIVEFFMGVIIVLTCTGICYYTYIHLPSIDFMAYKVGVNIIDDMELKDDAPQDVYEHTFIYEKDGKKQKFTIENLPDSTWKYVDTDAKLIKEGYTPPTRDFIVSDREGNYIHEELLSEKGYVLFITTPDIKKISYDKKDEVARLKKYAESKGVKFIMLSGSTDENNDKYLQNIGEDYPVYYSDATVVKSMVRSNPGIMLLRDGTIIKKWSEIDIPNPEKFQKVLGQSTEELIKESSNSEKTNKILVISILSGLFLLFSVAHIYKSKTENYL